MKKIINRPDDFVDEFLDGILLAHADRLRAASSDRRAVVRTDAGHCGKVGIVTGGGSGHLPLFLGYVGRGLASGVAVGNVFSSPSSAQIFAATAASDDGAGVLYLYGNYGGDVYNFDVAADLAANRGIRTETVRGNDDVVSAPPERAGTRRGVAGLFFAYKTAGAAAERGDDLDSVAEIAQRTVDRTRTMGVGLSPTILPAAGEPTFELGDGEMEMGIGIHGEPGHHRGPLETADEITDRFLEEILREIPVGTGDSVAVLVNGLGATPPEELYLIYRRVHQVLDARGARIHRRYIGEFATSLEMAGASLSIIKLDDELAELLDAPADSPFFQQGAMSPPEVIESGDRAGGLEAIVADTPIRTVDRPSRLRAMVLGVASRMPEHSDELRELDAALGDGDLGITITSGAQAVARDVGALPTNVHPSALLEAAGLAFAGGNPSTFAALFGGGLVAASTAFDETDTVDRTSVSRMVRAVQANVMKRGGAQVGDKTFVDVLDAVVTALDGTPGADPAALAAAAVTAAERVVADGASQRSQRGRASWVGDRSVGHADPGSVALLQLLREIAAQLG